MIATKRGTVSKTRVQAGDFLQIDFVQGEAPQLRFFRTNHDGCLLADNQQERILLTRPGEGVTSAAYAATMFFVIASVIGLKTFKLDRAQYKGGESFKVELLKS